AYRMKQNDQNKNDTTEKIQKVRSMWALLVETLTSLKKEKEIVDSVLEDCVNPCILDGTDVVLSVPALLTYKIESNVYRVKFLSLPQVSSFSMFIYYSLRRKEEHCEPTHQSLRRKQEIWESKWKMILGQCPFNLIFKDDLVSSINFI
ncbi:HAUS6 protein, partial [Emberiza fucata]|nr:HAUS6 protein [Emberiza fucata]